MRLILTTAMASIALAAAPLSAQPVTPMTPDVAAAYDPVLPSADFIRREAMIPMRDGTKLYTVIVMKKGTTGGPMSSSTQGGSQYERPPTRK